MYTRFTDEIRAKQTKERNERAVARSLKKPRIEEQCLITNIVLPGICCFLDKESIISLMGTSKQIRSDIKSEGLHVVKVKKKVSLVIPSTHQTRIEDFLAGNTGIQDLELIGNFSKCLPKGYEFPKILRLKKTTVSKEIPSEAFTNVRKLYMSDIDPGEVQRILERTPNLTKLSLDYVTDEILQIVKTFTKLEHFSVGRAGISSIGSAKLLYDVIKNCTNLKKLTFSPYTIMANDDYIFEYFAQMKLVAPELKKLKIGNSVTQINTIATCFPNLEILNMKATAKTVNFKSFKRLKRFTFANGVINDNITDVLHELPDSITELYIHGIIDELKHPKTFIDAMCTFLDRHPNLWSLGLNGNTLPMSSYIQIIRHLPSGLRDFGTTIPGLTDSIFLGSCSIMAKHCPRLRYVYCYNGDGFRAAKHITDDTIKKARKILETATIVTNHKLSVYVKHA